MKKDEQAKQSRLESSLTITEEDEEYFGAHELRYHLLPFETLVSFWLFSSVLTKLLTNIAREVLLQIGPLLKNFKRIIQN